MSIEEIIEGLDKLAKKHEVCANCQDLKPIAPVYLKTAQLLRAAIEKLKTHPDNQPNEPLTLEELRKMYGQPVWVKVIDHTVFADKEDDFDGWGMCRKSWVRVWDGERADIVKVDYHFEDYEQEWVAYRRPPKEET